MTMPFVTNCLRIWRPSCAITSTRRIAAGNGNECFSVARMRLRYLGRRPRSQSSHGLTLGFDKAVPSGRNAADTIRSIKTQMRTEQVKTRLGPLAGAGRPGWSRPSYVNSGIRRNEHLVAAGTCNPEVDPGGFVTGTDTPRMFTERIDAGVRFKANPLVETGVVEGADGPPELWG